MNDIKTLQECLEKFIAEEGISEREAARRLGVTSPALRNFLKSARNPSFKLVKAVCELTGEDISRF